MGNAIFLVSENEYKFLGMIFFVDIFLGSSQNWTGFRGQCTECGYFLGVKNFKYIFGNAGYSRYSTTELQCSSII